MAETVHEYARFPVSSEMDTGQGRLYSQHSYRQDGRHVTSSSSTGQVQGNKGMYGWSGNTTSVPENHQGLPEYPPDVLAMMVPANNQGLDINQVHHNVRPIPGGTTEVFHRHEKRSGVASTYENEEMMSYTTQHLDSLNPPQESQDDDEQYTLRLVGAADVNTGDHIGYGANFKIGTETHSEDSSGSFSHSQHYSVSSQQRYGTLTKNFTDSDNVQAFTQHLAKIGNTETEAVSLESLASFTQQQAKQWEDSHSEDSISSSDQRKRVGFVTTEETIMQQNQERTQTLPSERRRFERGISQPTDARQYNTMRNLTSESTVQQRQTSHSRIHSAPAFQDDGNKNNLVNRKNIKEYFSYDLRKDNDPSPASSVGGSRIDITVNISEKPPPPPPRSETFEHRNTSSTLETSKIDSQQNVLKRPAPPPVMPKPKTPKTPELNRGFDYTERLTIRGVLPGEYSERPAEKPQDLGTSEESTDVTSDMFDSDLEAMLATAAQKQGMQGEEHIKYVDGRCSCCPYGYHIDLTFLGILEDKNSASYLTKLKKIKRHKRNLRKSMEVYMQSQDAEHATPPPDIVNTESLNLMTMVEQDENATKGILSEIDSSVNETLDSIDNLIKSGPKKKRPKAPDVCDSDFSVSSGPQTTSSPRLVQSLNNTGSSSSLSSLESTDKNAPPGGASKTVNQTSSHHTAHHTTTTNITNVITSHQIAKNVQDCLNEDDRPAADPNAITPDQLQAIRDQMKLSLQRMRELEEQVKALPVLQVRISVLKEEKRLMMLQMEAEKNRKAKELPEVKKVRSIGVEANDRVRTFSVGCQAEKPKLCSVGIGESTIDEVDGSTNGRRSRSQSPSGRSFEITEFQSYRRNNITPMSKYFGKTSSGRSTPVSFDGPETVDSAVGDHNVSKIYYNQPDLVTEAQFAQEMNALRPDHVPELLRSFDKEQAEFEALERALLAGDSPVNVDTAKYSSRKPFMMSTERGEDTIKPTHVQLESGAPPLPVQDEFVTQTYIKPVMKGSSAPVIRDGVFKTDDTRKKSVPEDERPVPMLEKKPEEKDSPDNDLQPEPVHSSSHTHVHEKEITTIYMKEAQVKVAPIEARQSYTVSTRPELKKPLRTIGVGDGNVFEDPVPKVRKPSTRNTGSMVQIQTRDVGVHFESKVPEKPKPEMRDIGVGIEEMRVIEIGEFGEYYHTVPMTDEMLQQQREQQDQLSVVKQGGQARGERTIKTTSTTSYTERKNIILQEERIKTALRDALHRSVKSVGITCKMPSHEKGCITDLIRKYDKGSGEDTIEVEVRPVTDIRSVGVDVKPQTLNKYTAIDKPFTYNAMTNTPVPQPKEKSTNTSKVLSYPAAIQTDIKRTYSMNCGTDMKVFMATDQIKNIAVNTDRANFRNAETNTERKSLKSENYDFSIYFRDGVANTEVTSIKDLDVRDRGQNTMEPNDRDREISETEARRNFASYSANRNDNANEANRLTGGGSSGSISSSFTRTGTEVIVNRHVVESSGSADGSSPRADETVTRSSIGNLRSATSVRGSSGDGFSSGTHDNDRRAPTGNLEQCENIPWGSGGHIETSGSLRSSSGVTQSSTGDLSMEFRDSQGSEYAGSGGGNLQRTSSGSLGINSSRSVGGSSSRSVGMVSYSSSESSGSPGYDLAGSDGGSIQTHSTSDSLQTGSTMSGDANSFRSSGSLRGSSSSGVEIETRSSSRGLQAAAGGSSNLGSSGSSGLKLQMGHGGSTGFSSRESDGGSSSRSVETYSSSGSGGSFESSGSAGGSTRTLSSSGSVQVGSGVTGGISGSGSLGSTGGSILTHSSSGSVQDGSGITGGMSESGSLRSAGGSIQMHSSSGRVQVGSGVTGGMSESGSLGSSVSSSSRSVEVVTHSTGGNVMMESGGSSGFGVSRSVGGGGASLRETLGLPLKSKSSSHEANASLGGVSYRTTRTSSEGTSRGYGLAGGNLISSVHLSTGETLVPVSRSGSSPARRSRSSSGEQALLQMMGGTLQANESEMNLSKSSELESAAGVELDTDDKSSSGGLVFENKGALQSSGKRLSGEGYDSGLSSMSASLEIENKGSGLTSFRSSSGGSFSGDAQSSGSESVRGMSSGGETEVSRTGSQRVIVSTSETVTTYSSSTSVGKDRGRSESADSSEVNVSSAVKESDAGDGDPDAESQSDVFGQENNGTIIRKHVVTRSAIPVRSGHVSKQVHLTKAFDQNGNENAGKQSSGGGFGQALKSFVSDKFSSLSSPFSPGRTKTIVEGSSEISETSSDSSGNTNLSSFGSTSSPLRTRTIVEGNTEITHSTSSSSDHDTEVLAQLKELEKDIEASHAKHLSSSEPLEMGSLEADIEASHGKHFESIKEKFMSGKFTRGEQGLAITSEGQNFLTTGAISLTPTSSSKLSSTSVTFTVGSTGETEMQTDKVDGSSPGSGDGSSGSLHNISKSVSDGSLEYDGSDSSLKSIMKRSGSFEGNKGQKKEIKFAVGTMGGYISTSSDEDTSETDTESDSDSIGSYDEGSYDGRQGCIVYLCKDDEAIAQGIPGAKMFDQNIRETFDLNPEMKASCFVYADYLRGDKELSEEERKAHLATIQAGWFKVSSERLSNPHEVEDYLSSFCELDRELLQLVINLSDANGNSSVHYAVSHCNFDIVNLLLDTELCDVNKQNRAGYTPIMLASLAQVQTDQDKDVVRRLFREGDVNIKASQAGQTALMLAVSHGKKDMVKLLLDCGADINAQDEDGSTALMCSSEHGHTDIVKVLLAQPECDPSIVDQDGSTALAIAMEAGHRDVAVLLYAKRGPKSPVRSPVSISPSYTLISNIYNSHGISITEDVRPSLALAPSSPRTSNEDIGSIGWGFPSVQIQGKESSSISKAQPSEKLKEMLGVD